MQKFAESTVESAKDFELVVWISQLLNFDIPYSIAGGTAVSADVEVLRTIVATMTVFKSKDHPVYNQTGQGFRRSGSGKVLLTPEDLEEILTFWSSLRKGLDDHIEELWKSKRSYPSAAMRKLREAARTKILELVKYLETPGNLDAEAGPESFHPCACHAELVSRRDDFLEFMKAVACGLSSVTGGTSGSDIAKLVAAQIAAYNLMCGVRKFKEMNLTEWVTPNIERLTAVHAALSAVVSKTEATLKENDDGGLWAALKLLHPRKKILDLVAEVIEAYKIS